MFEQIFRVGEQEYRPWSGGQTCTIHQFPTTSDYLFRVSIATIEHRNTIFSSFPGYNRTHLLLEGASRLSFESEEIEMRGSHPQHQFNGESTCRCELFSDSARAWNVIYKPELRVKVIAPASVTNLPLDAINTKMPVYEILHCLRHTGTIHTTRPLSITEGDTLIIIRYPGEPACNIQNNDKLQFVYTQIAL